MGATPSSAGGETNEIESENEEKEDKQSDLDYELDVRKVHLAGVFPKLKHVKKLKISGYNYDDASISYRIAKLMQRNKKFPPELGQLVQLLSLSFESILFPFEFPNNSVFSQLSNL